MTETFDMLYQKSLAGLTGELNIYELITSKKNILLAYRNIKTNTGSRTSGVDRKTINDYKIENEYKFIKDIRKRLQKYTPQTVRRVNIPKDDGRVRPLGIPTMEDRLIQQMFKQILEPICEAKFYKHSYGFRPARNTIDAKARVESLINLAGMYHVVDIDIESFFDNINHARLIKQCFNIGIKDKKVLALISKMLKAPIEGEGIPTKGTPQGGILSPLLSNIALNDLDWWISNQWETFKPRRVYAESKNGQTGGQYKCLRETSQLKEMFIVRYADDFKIFTRTYKSAKKIYYAVEGYLNQRLKLSISKSKSGIIDVRKKKLDFLGFSITAEKKGTLNITDKNSIKYGQKDKYVAQSHIKEKTQLKIKEKLRNQIKKIQRNPTRANILVLNSMILGIHNYYRYASQSSTDLGKIAYRLQRTLYNSFKSIAKYKHPSNPDPTYKRLYKTTYKTYEIDGIYIYPIADVTMTYNTCFQQKMTPYTKEGRELIQKREERSITYQFKRLLESASYSETLEYNDNRLSKYSEQLGKCAITKKFLSADNVRCHHIIPRNLGGTDEYKNLMIIDKDIHQLIHAVEPNVINYYIEKNKLSNNQIIKLNKLRANCNLNELIVS